MALETCCLIGRGKVYMRKLANPQVNPLVFVGNVEQLNLTIDESEISVQDFTTAAGGKDCSQTKIDAVNMNMIMRCFKPENIAKAIYGNVVPQSASSVSNEAHTVLGVDSFIPFNKLANMAGTIVVTGPSASPTYVEGTDWERGNNGIYIPAGSSLEAEDALEIDYPAIEGSTIEFLTNAGQEYELVLDGINGENNQPFFVQLYRVKLSTATQLDFISSEFGQIEVPGQVLKSATIAGDADTSAYGRMRI